MQIAHHAQLRPMPRQPGSSVAASALEGRPGSPSGSAPSESGDLGGVTGVNAGVDPSLDPVVGEAGVLKLLESAFDRWDGDGNGQISWSEIRSSVANPEVKGPEAAALATLYTLVEQDGMNRGLERRPPVSYERMYDLYYDLVDENDQPVADSLFLKYTQKLEASTSELFPQGLPHAYMAKQGTGPSCGFLAPTFAQAVKDPNSIKDAIAELENGHYKVSFPGLSKAVSVDPLTETERALFATAEQNGSWIGVLEKAWGTHQAGRNRLAAFEQTTAPEDAIRAWTGTDAVTTSVPASSALKAGEIPEYLSDAGRQLTSNGMVVAWTKFDDLSEKDLVPGHAYTVLGIDAEAGTVSLRNPWGRFEPTDQSGEALDGHDDGLFEFSLEKFTENFGQIARQAS